MTNPLEKTQNCYKAIKILYKDDHLFAVAKPAGVFVHRTPLCRERGVLLLQEARNLYGNHLYPVHRLDRPTSGVVVFAANPQIAKILSEAFRKKEVEKTYIAVVRGWTQESGIIDKPLAKIMEGPSLAAQTKEQEAITKYRTIAQTEIPIAVSKYPKSRYSLVLVNPITGRRHQIRRHLKHISHPIIGDVLYGDGKHNRFFRSYLNSYRLLLHSLSIRLKHPVRGNPLKITSPPDYDLQRVLSALGWEDVMKELLEKL